MVPRLPSRDWHRTVLAATGIGAALAIAVIFLLPADLLPGSPRADLGQQFLAWRAFAADSLRHGRLPLWNPYVYAGEPFLGGFQSAVFYPPNALFLVFPLCRAVNLSLLLHGLILGAGMYRWAHRRGLHPLAAATGALVLVFGGTVFPQVYAGHLSNLCTLAWAPWIFAGVEAWWTARDRRALVLAVAAAALQILGGQIQYAFYTGIAVILQLIVMGAGARRGQHVRAGAWALVAIYGGAALLAAAQLLPGWRAASEGLRQGTLPAEFAGQFSLPPENLLTAVAPGFFGDPVRHLYWGRCYPWEMSVFLGAGAALLLLVALTEPLYRRRAAACLAVAIPLLLLALGRHTPLFRPLLAYAPGFGLFRGWSKFDFPALVFIALAVAEGADALLRLPQIRTWAPAFVWASGAVWAGLGAGLIAHPTALAPWLLRVNDSGESYLSHALLTDPSTILAAGNHAGWSLIAGGATALVAGGCVWLGRSTGARAWRWVALGVIPLELAVFAHTQWATFRQSDSIAPEQQAFVAAHPGDYRVQNLVGPNNGYLVGAPDLWGNDPGVLKRYAEFMAFSQGMNPDHANQNVDFHSITPLYSLLRLSYVLNRTAAGFREYPLPNAMARVQLLSRYRVIPSRDALFAALARPEFDATQTVLLESEPVPAPRRPIGGERASVRVLDDTPDAFTVEATTAAPALLLVTDAYSRDWRARALSGSSQKDYEVMPADYVLRATPLSAGRHLIRFEYRPAGLSLGIAISGLAWIGWLLLLYRTRAPRLVPTPA